MITVERITAAVRSLESGQLPDQGPLETLCDVFKKLQHGLSYEQAAALSGTAAKRERNEALLRAAQRLNPDGALGPWALAELLRLHLQLRVKNEDLSDAAKQGACDLSRSALYLILTQDSEDDTGED